MNVDNIIHELRNYRDEINEQQNDLVNLREEINDAIVTLKDTEDNVSNAIDALESLSEDLNVSFSFHYQLNDIELSPNL